jgi:two-component system, LuxR family, response regulator FixJ
MQRLEYVAIVDDDEPMRRAITRLLRMHHMTSRSFSSAHAFLDVLRFGAPDCLIVDVQMPDMTGIELLGELLNRGISIPSIVITGNDDKAIAARAGSLGAAAFFLKPVSQSALIAAITSAKAKQ